MSIVLQGSTSGSITLQEPAIAGSTVLSLPATTGTILTSASPSSDLPSSINGPAFYAYNTGTQSITQNVSTKLQFPTEGFDTANCFDNTTNYRFTPNVAGYYQLTGGVFVPSTSTQTIIQLFKNGSLFMEFCRLAAGSPNVGGYGSGLVYANGSTDYFELYIVLFAATVTVGAGQPYFYFTGSMVRTA